MTMRAERAYSPLGRKFVILRQNPRHKERGRSKEAGSEMVKRGPDSAVVQLSAILDSV